MHQTLFPLLKATDTTCGFNRWVAPGAQICTKMPQMAKNGPDWPKNDPNWPTMAQKWPQMTPNGPKNDPEWPKMAQKWQFDIWGFLPGTEIEKKCIPLSSTFDVEAPFQRYVLKKLNFGPKMTFCYPGGTYLGPKSKKNAARYFNFWHRGTVSEISA